MVRRTLAAYDAQCLLVCMPGVALPTIENGLAVPLDLGGGKRGIRLTYTLRPDARWGDGVPVTTGDVLFTYEVGRNPKSGIGNSELYRRITHIAAKDAKTFTVDIDKLTCDYAALDDFELLPAHLERAAFADPTQYRFRTLYDTDSTNPGLYFRPYRLTEVSSGSHIVLEPNPTWWGEKPAFSRIILSALEYPAPL